MAKQTPPASAFMHLPTSKPSSSGRPNPKGMSAANQPSGKKKRTRALKGVRGAGVKKAKGNGVGASGSASAPGTGARAGADESGSEYDSTDDVMLQDEVVDATKDSEGEVPGGADDPAATAENLVGMTEVKSKGAMKRERAAAAMQKRDAGIARLVPVIIDGVPIELKGVGLCKELANLAPGVDIKRVSRMQRGGVLIVPCSPGEGAKLVDLSKSWPAAALGGNARVHFAGEMSDRAKASKAQEKLCVVAYGLDPAISVDELREYMPDEIKDVRPLSRTAMLLEVETEEAIECLCRNGLRVLCMLLRCKRYVEKAAALQCYNCQGFGHVAAKCKDKPKCLKCCGEHKTTSCTADAVVRKCANCGSSDHTAAYKGCPTFRQARTDMHQQQLSSKKSYAAALVRKSLVAAQTAEAAVGSIHSPPGVRKTGKATTSDAECQTESADAGCQAGPELPQATISAQDSIISLVGGVMIALVESMKAGQTMSSSNACGIVAKLSNQVFNMDISGETIWTMLKSQTSTETQNAEMVPISQHGL
jgi:hypothetical protein